MRLPRMRLTIGRIMVAIALVAVALVALPEPVFVIPLPGAKTATLTRPDGTIVGPGRAAIFVTRFGAMLMVAVAGSIVVAAVWLVRRLLGIAHREVRPTSPE